MFPLSQLVCSGVFKDNTWDKIQEKQAGFGLFVSTWVIRLHHKSHKRIFL